ncbi:ABC transporter ATP-binding protein [Patescibacteria group bacterium]
MSVIKVEGLKKYFGKIKAVDGISFEVEQGEVFGFLGPNGAGKTTTIRCMMDFIRPTDGKIVILDNDSYRDTVKLKKKIGYLSGAVKLYGKWTGNDHIEFIRHLNGKDDNADELVKRLEFDTTRKAKHLSSGNRQKLGIIMALMTKPEVMVMDEPTNALDPLLQHEIYDLLKEMSSSGSTVFMSSHNLAEVEKVCTRVGIIREGKMVATESIQSLKEKRIFTVNVSFTDKFNKEDLIGGGITIKEEMPSGLILNVTGDLNPILEKLAQHKVRDLSIIHASLEEIFLESYE